MVIESLMYFLTQEDFYCICAYSSDHDPGRKQETVERHWLNTTFNRPVTGQVQPEVF